jgi:hypothetical protein
MQALPAPNPKNEENKKKEATLKHTIEAYVAPLALYASAAGWHDGPAAAMTQQHCPRVAPLLPTHLDSVANA